MPVVALLRAATAGVPTPFRAIRYHSLAGKRDTLPACLRITCESPGGIIQGVRHATWAVEGVQFHPESILTEHGHAMFANFLAWSSPAWPAGGPPTGAAPVIRGAAAAPDKA